MHRSKPERVGLAHSGRDQHVLENERAGAQNGWMDGAFFENHREFVEKALAWGRICRSYSVSDPAGGGPTCAGSIFKTLDRLPHQDEGTMRTFGKLALTLSAVVLMSLPAQAQQGRGFGGGMGMGGGMLLRNASVQKEIKATEDQVSKLNALAEDLQAKGRENFEKLRDLGDDERREKMQEYARTTQAEINKGLAEILKPEQSKRFHQIQAQSAGIQAFSMPRVAEALKLTDEQKEKLRELNMSQFQAMGELREQFQNDREGAMKKMAEIRKEGMTKAVALLTDAQKDAWKTLTGDPFEVVFERRPQ